MNFAARRRSPLFSTQFTLLNPPVDLQAQDLRRATLNPPRFVIGYASPSLEPLLARKSAVRFRASYGAPVALKPNPRPCSP